MSGHGPGFFILFIGSFIMTPSASAGCEGQDSRIGQARSLCRLEKKLTAPQDHGLVAKRITDKPYGDIVTFRSQVRSIYEKLQVQNRVEMMRKTGRAR